MEGVIPDVFDDLEIGIMVHDPETGAIVGVNERLEELYGYTESQLREMEVGAYSVADSGFTQEEAVRRIRAAVAGEPQIFEWHVERADGSRVWVRVRLAETTLAGEEYVVAEIRDITDQKEGERELRDRQAFVDSVAEAIPDVFYAFDEYGQFYEWNERLTEVTGYTDEEIAEMTPPEFFPADEQSKIAEAVANVVSDEEPLRVESAYLTRDGERIPYEFSGGPLYDGEGNVVGVAGIGRDITERKESQRQIERSNDRLQRFAYVLSHDLQEPLRMVSSYMDLLEVELEEHLDEETREYMDFAVDGAERMQSMIDGLLQYSRVETRGGDFAETDLDAVLTDVRHDLKLKLDESNVEVDVGDLPTVTADTEQMAQLFQNLLKNAVEHGSTSPDPQARQDAVDDGSPGTTVEVTATETADAVEFAVTDDGPGIPEDEQSDLFGLFEKGADSDGTGIGLAVCDRIADRHGGDIAVESEPGEGTTFRVTLPKSPD